MIMTQILLSNKLFDTVWTILRCTIRFRTISYSTAIAIQTFRLSLLSDFKIPASSIILQNLPYFHN